LGIDHLSKYVSGKGYKKALTMDDAITFTSNVITETGKKRKRLLTDNRNIYSAAEN
jgi:hypothetical protein